MKNILFETKFLENITTETRIRMSEMEKETSKDIVNYISKVEETIHNDRRYNKHKDISKLYERKNNIETEDRNKYCSFHKTKTHNTADCFGKKRSENENKFNSNNNLIIKNSNLEGELLYLNSKISGQEIRCIVDTGSTYSVISKKFTDENNIETSNIKPVYLTTASEDSIKTDKKFSTNINFTEMPNATLRVDFF
ncbi:hypothetical protein DMUE_4851 [Dictyocoela muelleri]|nr:hypothetical protein DMUE_4851 [Dictyocoela muelleri]